MHELVVAEVALVARVVVTVGERKKVGCHWCCGDLVLVVASLSGLYRTSLSLKSLLVLVGMAVNFDFREARRCDGG